MSRDGGTNRLSSIRLRGTPAEIGAGLGAFGRAAVHGHLLKTANWHDLMVLRDDARVERMAAAVRGRFARYWAEIEGLALGLELPVRDVFLWNCRGDLLAGSPDGCTTVQVPGLPHIIGHNEDGDPGLAGHCALAQVAGDGTAGFTAFVYPGSLPGHTFAVTGTGLVQTVNNTRPVAGGDGVPRMVLTRSILDVATLDDAVAILRAAPRAGSFHVTLAQAGDSRLTSIEFTERDVSVRVLGGPGVHANHLTHDDTRRSSQVVTGSSDARQRRGEALVGARPPAGEAEVLDLLWDTGDAELPIYRTDPRDADGENTLATAVFRVGADIVEWSVYAGAHEPACYGSADVNSAGTGSGQGRYPAK